MDDETRKQRGWKKSPYDDTHIETGADGYTEWDFIILNNMDCLEALRKTVEKCLVEFYQ